MKGNLRQQKSGQHYASRCSFVKCWAYSQIPKPYIWCVKLLALVFVMSECGQIWWRFEVRRNSCCLAWSAGRLSASVSQGPGEVSWGECKYNNACLGQQHIQVIWLIWFFNFLLKYLKGIAKIDINNCVLTMVLTFNFIYIMIYLYLLFSWC